MQCSKLRTERIFYDNPGLAITSRSLSIHGRTSLQPSHATDARNAYNKKIDSSYKRDSYHKSYNPLCQDTYNPCKGDRLVEPVRITRKSLEVIAPVVGHLVIITNQVEEYADKED